MSNPVENKNVVVVDKLQGLTSTIRYVIYIIFGLMASATVSFITVSLFEGLVPELYLEIVAVVLTLGIPLGWCYVFTTESSVRRRLLITILIVYLLLIIVPNVINYFQGNLLRSTPIVK